MLCERCGVAFTRRSKAQRFCSATCRKMAHKQRKQDAGAGAPLPPSGLAAAVAAGRRDALTALRDHLALALEQAAPERAAPLAKELREVLRELDALAEPKGSTVDDLARRRAARRSAAASG